jgi:glycerol-3-phosphate acyltransferase PlsY
MSPLVTAILVALGGYLLGSIPFGLLITRAAGAGDIRSIGSGNIGATNVLRTGRKGLALATLLCDAGKGAAAVLVARALFGSDIGAQSFVGELAGGAAFLGHCFPVWLGFKGGKGVATFFGVLFAAAWPVALACAVTWLAVAFVSKFSSLGALAAAALAPVYAFVFHQGTAAIGLCLAMALVIYARHKANIGRLLAGTEPRIGQGKDKTAG